MHLWLTLHALFFPVCTFYLVKRKRWACDYFPPTQERESLIAAVVVGKYPCSLELSPIAKYFLTLPLIFSAITVSGDISNSSTSVVCVLDIEIDTYVVAEWKNCWKHTSFKAQACHCVAALGKLLNFSVT